MAITNHERVGKAMDLLRDGLAPFVERELVGKDVTDGYATPAKPVSDQDAAGLLKLIWDNWQLVFRNILGNAERSLVAELRDWRNKWAHQESISGDDAYRALDSASRLLAAVSAPQWEELDKIKNELLRVRFDEQARGERRKQMGAAIESGAAAGLKPWREVITPHGDVASGRYQQAEFAADLWQVHVGEGTAEYRDPVEFFRRTYLTESLKRLLVRAVERLTGQGGDPVVDLQTNFGGGKTHSMLALYHLFSGVGASELMDMEPIMQEAGPDPLPTVTRVVLVGNKISPGNPSIKSDGTTVRTLWGELAWQLGGKRAFERIRADDERATSPGDVLRELLNEYGPCLILIDEWVAYARQLHDHGDLPAGSFETQFTFAQALTEAAKAAESCLLVISLPASDSGGLPHADDAEVGGQRGREALDRLRNVVGRVESSWRPASAEEGFEIVRRRLFEPLTDTARFKDRDVVARAFADLYRTQHQEFPVECRDADYEKRIRAAYPIHPEIFDRLYTDWSTLVSFQRTRGVLRLMAAVIHSLWEGTDRTPLILPANISINDGRVQFELTRYLPDHWVPILEKDVDGAHSLPLRIDGQTSNLGKFSAARRVARTIYLGSAPTVETVNRGLEDRHIKLGCVLPGESPAVFGDALRRLAGAATYLYQDGNRYWYSTQPTVTKLAEDRAEQLGREPDKVIQELRDRLTADLKLRGDFNRVHPLPQSGQDVPDDRDARLVVLRSDQPYSRESDTPAQAAAASILESRGSAPRLYRNSLVFLAADRTRLQDLDDALRRYLAWESIVAEREQLDLSPHQVKQAETQKEAASSAVTARLPETYQWLLVPVQPKPQDAMCWQVIRLAGQDALAVRASRRLKNEEHLVTALGATRLRMEMDRIPLWRGHHVDIREIVEDFARYPYLPRLKDSGVVLDAIASGVALLSWQQDSFAFAESYDDDGQRYRGLRANQMITLPDGDSSGMLVKPEGARQQLDAENAAANTPTSQPDTPGTGGETTGTSPETDPKPSDTSAPARPKRFHGTVSLGAMRAGLDASRIADEVISHLAGLVGANVAVTLEIEAEIPDGAPDHVVRTVTENSHTLKFTSHGFEEE